jgi:LCP family protein required for cell wall assembly
MYTKLLCLCLGLIIGLGSFAVSAEPILSNQELTDLLWEMSLQDEGGGEFVVLPEDYQLPAAGLDGVYRLLILGIDTDDQRMRGRSDTMILAVLDARKGSLKLISFMRDTYVSIPGRGHNRLNAAYAFGGDKLLRQTLADSFGVTADGYIAVNFSIMASLIDAIGGVELPVETFELGPLNGILSYYNYQRGVPEEQGRLGRAGTQLLTGLQAMSYARIRKPDSDFERVTRQQRVMEAIYRKMLNLEAGSLANIILRFADRVATDISLTEALGVLSDLLKVQDLILSALRVPVQGAFSAKLLHDVYFLVPNLKRNKAAIADFLEADR